jgi:hypothetical protein
VAGTGEQEYLAELMRRPIAGPPDEAEAAIAASPFEPSLAQALADADRLCDPEPLEVETGWTVLPDGSVQVAVATAMPDLTPEMVEWWFDWHPRRSGRYRVWHPSAHIANALVPADPPQAKPSWGTVNLVEEDIGSGPITARIEFLSPSNFGFAGDYPDDATVGTIICARVGDSRVTHTDMAHVFLRDGEGLMLRSRFWIGERIRPRLPGPADFIGEAIEPFLSRRTIRRLAIPAGLGPGLTRHCAEEYSHLNLILPGLFERFGS